MRTLFLIFALLLAPGAAFAATLVVTTTADSGPGSLRQLISNAADGDEIVFAPAIHGQTITLTSQILVRRILTVAGPGQDLITISGGGTTRIFDVNTFGGDLTLRSLRLTNGFQEDTPTAVFGGGLVLNRGTLTIESCRLDSSEGSRGGAIYNLEGRVEIRGSLIEGNTATIAGGAVNTRLGTLIMENTTVRNNMSTGPSGPTLTGGGGVFVETNSSSSDIVVITTSLFEGNSSASGGGAFLRGQGGTNVPLIVNSTFSGNSATTFGGAIFALRDVEIASSTIVGNSSADNGGGIESRSGSNGPTVIIGSSLVANNTAPNGPDIRSTVASAGFNLVTDISGSGGITDGVNNDQVVSNAGVAALADNGGTTKTHALASTSPAVDAGFCTSASTAPFVNLLSDQRGFGGTAVTRVVDGPAANASDACDIGAFEFGAGIEFIARFDTRVYLEGAYRESVGDPTNTSSHATSGRLPVNQPFSGPPWNYAGTETRGSFNGVSDWVLVELRRTPEGPAEYRAAGLVGSLSTLVEADNVDELPIRVPRAADAFFITLRFRNHLDVTTLTAIPLNLITREFDWDGFFETGEAYDPGTITKPGTFFAARAGDMDADNEVTGLDAVNVWRTQDGSTNSYLAGDLDFDGDVDENDLLLLWLPSNGQ